MEIPIVLQQGGKAPVRGSDGAAGYDLYASRQVEIWPDRWIAIPTGVHLAIPDGFWGHIMPRSGLAYNFGLMVLAGVIDSDYRGEVKVILYNPGETPYLVSEGDRIAQIIFLNHMQGTFCELKKVEELPPAKRGQAGFGSTGKA